MTKRWVTIGTMCMVGALAARTGLVAGTGPARAAESEPKAGEIWKESRTGMEFVYVAGGAFTMGSPASEDSRDDDERQHDVTVDGCWMSKHEVTVDQFTMFATAAGYRTDAEKEGSAPGFYDNNWAHNQKGANWCNPGFAQTGTHPVVCMSWNDAVAFAEWLSQKGSDRFRLPTEAEWEYACRAGSEAARFWGDDPNVACGYANVADRTAQEQFRLPPMHECSDGYAWTAPVGSLRANAFGLHDMLGNAWEWCSDWYADYPTGHVTNPAGPSSGSDRVGRGGGWISVGQGVRSAERHANSPLDRDNYLGFRLVRIPSQ